MPAVSFVKLYRKIRVPIRGLVSGVILLGCAGAVLADGNYQRTKDGKTIVWNDNPRPGDVATWSGDRDSDGYADGFGTLTWYTTRRQGPEAKETLYAYYFGNMVRGKFHGPVNGHSKGVTAHAVFNHGKRTGRWAAGTAASWASPRPSVEPSREEVGPSKQDTPSPAELNSPPPRYALAAADRPRPDYNGLREQQTTTGTESPAEGPPPSHADASTPPTTEPPQSKPALVQSVRSLTVPPATLRPASEASSEPSDQPDEGRPAASPQLGKEEVIALADQEAQKRGYQVGDYNRPDPLFDSLDGAWSLSYQPKTANGSNSPNKHFTVAIDDKSKKTAIVPGR